MHTLALYQLKGGVGKTSSAVNLAAMAAAEGHATLLWDLDPQAAATWLLQGRPAVHDAKQWLKGRSPIGRSVQRTAYAGLDLLPGTIGNRLLDLALRKLDPPHLALKRLLRPFSEDYRYLIIDSPPALGHLGTSVLVAADVVLMPVVPGFLAWRAAEQVRDLIAAEGLPAGRLVTFFTLVDRRRGLHRAQLDAPAPEGIETLPVAVPYAASVERMGEHRAPLAAFADPGDPALLAYAALWTALRERCGV